MELMFKFFQELLKDSEVKVWNPSDKDKEESRKRKNKTA